MRFSKRVAVAAAGIAVALVASACGNSGGGDSGGKGSKDVEVFTWWADGGEKAGLDGLVSQFGTDCSGFKFVNGAVAGGAGANAKQVLASASSRATRRTRSRRTPVPS
jgi:glucose/mannose transport system substrate-binding protein